MTHVVLFRTGGISNFKWHASLALPEAEAQVTASSVRKMGFLAHPEPVGIYDTLGLPTSFTVSPARQIMWQVPFAQG
ncbi:MAG: hypothetical protein LC723_12235 [Actinobacteria bacterium]|nr:hypothetical protein [Actinomycetota bacterium]